MIPLAAFLLAGCLAVDPASDRVTAGDVAPAFPGMETVDAGTPLALAPAPGVSRVFHRPELSRWADRFHLSLPPAEICVERKAAPLDPNLALAAMRAAFPKAEIEILDWTRTRVPEGEITFPAGQLRNGAAGQLWSGYVLYGGAHRFPVWARVKVRLMAQCAVALRDLPAGQPIAPDAVDIQSRETAPGAVVCAASIDQIAGKWPRTLVQAGTLVRRNQLAEPLSVLRGDIVKVEARSGGAHLEFEARAEGSGTNGDLIAVTNPTSHRRFPARIAGKGRVTVEGAEDPGKT